MNKAQLIICYRLIKMAILGFALVIKHFDRAEEVSFITMGNQLAKDFLRVFDKNR